MKYKFAMFDIDGTLAGFENNKRVFNQKNVEMLEKLHQAGVYVGLASGRSIDNLLSQKDEFGLNFQFDCLVGVNGGQMYDNTVKKKYKFFELDPDTIHEIVTMMEPTGCNCHIYCDDYTIYRYYDETVDVSRAYYKNDIRVATCIDDMCQHSAPKVQYNTPIETSKEIEKYALEHCTDHYECVRTTFANIEFMPKGCNKSYAIEQFCKMHGFSMEEVIAFGDNTNDNKMLIDCGCGVCLADGNPTTIAIADMVTEKSCSDGGAGYFIEKHWDLFDTK